ncbi:zinc finger and SCAN domain-containing protein 2-like [Clupea harengus]|uniref:Zinc finger and SCAN domain-containing protein 2-like n=1 Tax=Clupea harengus TaxID=7950 RepID=A0A6P3W884_CLUHA|nr:zinc finger and SCAN domain-containing protein 2-like [Clupea harengus]
MNENLRVFQTQFASIMEILLSAAMAETAKLYESCVLEIRAEISRVQAENNTLKCHIIQTSEPAGCYTEQSEEWIPENRHFVGRPVATSGTTESCSSLAEVIPQKQPGRQEEQAGSQEEAPFIKEEASDSEELKAMCQMLPTVHTPAQMKMTADQNTEWTPLPNEIKLESSPHPVTMEMRIVSLEQSSLQVFHEAHASAGPSDRAHSAGQHHTGSHGNPRATCMAPPPAVNALTVDISTRHFHHQSEEDSSYSTTLPSSNRPAHTPSTFNGNTTKTSQKTVPVRHLPTSPLPGSGLHRCKVCGKTFHSRRGLCGHQQVHQGERTHQCSQCGKSFLYQSSLMHHLRSHAGTDGGYSCTFCQRKFISKANLSIHLVTHTKEHPFQCSVCGLTFGSRAVLHAHLKSHSGEPRYTCSHCGKKFLDLGNFSRHKRIHTGERPYSCEVCGKAFIQSAHLKKHILTHR